MSERTSPYLIVIGIPTYKRPEGLSRLLDSISKMDIAVNLHIIVADNEGAYGVGISTVDKMAGSGYPHKIRAIGVDDRGVAAVRNALLHEAFDIEKADYLAMVDDDEWVEPQWLSALLDMQHTTHADVVGGKVVADYLCTPPTWSNNLKIYYSETGRDGEVDMIWGGGNCLLSKGVYRAKGDVVLFDNYFSVIGGEDDEYFIRLKDKYGCRFAYASQAITHETFGADRLNIRWAWGRSFRIGYSHVQILKSHGAMSVGRIVSEICVICAAVMKSLALGLLNIFVPEKRMIGPILLARQLGKISGLLSEQEKI